MLYSHAVRRSVPTALAIVAVQSCGGGERVGETSADVEPQARAVAGEQAAVELISPLGAPFDYEEREALASPRETELLADLRQAIQERESFFEVGYTAAADHPIESITGLIEPEGFLEQAARQNEMATEHLLSERPRLAESLACSPTAERFDLRRDRGTPPIRDQGICGSCWAFTTIGAVESTLGRPIDLRDGSEQHVLDCSQEGTCRGGWWAFDFLLNQEPNATEMDYPYVARDQACDRVPPRVYEIQAWGYVSAAAPLPSTDEIKDAVCSHGALAVAVNATEAFKRYTGGVFDEDDPGRINHGVTLIGWDDTKESAFGRGAWLIKNSWGEGWGETGGFGASKGYMWIAYQSNQIGRAAAWVHPKP